MFRYKSTLSSTNIATVESAWKISFLLEGPPVRCHVGGREGSLIFESHSAASKFFAKQIAKQIATFSQRIVSSVTKTLVMLEVSTTLVNKDRDPKVCCFVTSFGAID